jgi:hypothetical protein
MTELMPFGEVLEAADRLSQDEQQELIAILNRRLAQAEAQSRRSRYPRSSPRVRQRGLPACIA